MKNVIDLLGDLATQDFGQDPLQHAFVLDFMGLGAVVASKNLMISARTDFNNAGNVLAPSV
jgi:hypothetical protein